MPELARTYRVLAPELPGLSGSGRMAGGALLREYVGGLTELLAAHERVSLVGNSLGAVVALAYSLERPVERLVLADMARVGVRQPLVNRLIARPAVGRLVPLTSAVPPGLVTRGLGRRGDTGLTRERLVALARVGQVMTRELVVSDLFERLPDVTTPTLVLWGDRDALVPVRYGQTLARRIPGARIELLDAGHRPQIEAAEAFLDHVIEFLG